MSEPEVTDEMAERAWAVLSKEIHSPFHVETSDIGGEWDLLTAAAREARVERLAAEMRGAHARSLDLMRKVLSAALQDKQGGY